MTEQWDNWRRQKEMLVVRVTNAAGPGTAQPLQPLPFALLLPDSVSPSKPRFITGGGNPALLFTVRWESFGWEKELNLVV